MDQSTEGVHGPGVHVLYFPFDSWLVKIRADFGSAQNIQLVHGFVARTELLALAGVESLVFVGRKRDRGKTKSSSVVVGEFLLSVRLSSPLSNGFVIYSLEVGFLSFLGSSTPAMLTVFPRSYANALMRFLPQ